MVPAADRAAVKAAIVAVGDAAAVIVQGDQECGVAYQETGHLDSAVVGLCYQFWLGTTSMIAQAARRVNRGAILP